MAAFIGKDVKKLKAKGGKWKYLSVGSVHDPCPVDANILQEKEMLDISAPFAPYRSVFMWYMVCDHPLKPLRGSHSREKR